MITTYRYKPPRTAFVCNAFTLVEILIVVILLALLSAIIIPQYSDAVNESRLSILKSNLVVIRSAITRYNIDHNEWPGKNNSIGDTCPNGGSAGTGPANKAQALLDQLIFYTDIIGKSCSTTDTTYQYGPYLNDQRIPVNPFSGSNNVIISTVGELGLTSTRVDGKGGWIYDVFTGQIIADDAAYDDL